MRWTGCIGFDRAVWIEILGACERLAELAGGKQAHGTVHDELVFEVDEANAKEAGEAIRAHMAGAMKLDVPLVVDVGWGASWAKAH